MTASPRLAATIALAALIIILWLSVVYESGRIPISEALRASGPTVALGLVPLLLIVWQLRNGPDRLGLAVGIAFPVVVFALIAIALLQMSMGNSEQQMNFLGAVLMFMLSRSGFVIELVFLPTLGWLLVSSMREYAALSSGGSVPFLAGVFAITALGVVVPFKKWKPVARPEVRSFRADQSLYAFGLIYPCLWRVAGPDGFNRFPETLADLSGADDGAQGSVCADWRELENETHLIDYRRRDSGFLLTISERARRGAPFIRLSVDETGIVRQAHLDSTGREVEKETAFVNIDPLINLFFVSEYIEMYARSSPGIGYPLRIIGGESEQSIEGDALRLTRPFEAGVTPIPNASCLLVEGRVMIYTPILDSNGRATAYSISVLQKIREPVRRLELTQLRSYLRDEHGVIHATGAPRPATRDDPAIPPDEQTVAAARAAKWVQGREEDRARKPAYGAHKLPAASP